VEANVRGDDEVPEEAQLRNAADVLGDDEVPEEARLRNAVDLEELREEAECLTHGLDALLAIAFFVWEDIEHAGVASKVPLEDGCNKPDDSTAPAVAIMARGAHSSPLDAPRTKSCAEAQRNNAELSRVPLEAGLEHGLAVNGGSILSC